MTGVVNADLEPLLPVAVLAPGGGQQLVVALIDTGYTGELTLPPATIAALKLVWYYNRKSTMADGPVIEHPTYRATLNWDGVLRPVIIDQADTLPLIGSKLLAGYDLQIALEPGSRVLLGPLPPRDAAIDLGDTLE